MKAQAKHPYYRKIANDIAQRISTGEFQEGERIYGRSKLASEYKSSPETIRRALKLLGDMKVVSIKPQSGATILSRDNALRFLSSFEEDESVISIIQEIKSLQYEFQDLSTRMTNAMDRLSHSRYSFSDAVKPLPNFEITIPIGSNLNGRSIGSIDFWQKTHCTIIAIRRGTTNIISPGPNAEIYDGDSLVVIGSTEAVDKVKSLISS